MGNWMSKIHESAFGLYVSKTEKWSVLYRGIMIEVRMHRSYDFRRETPTNNYCGYLKFNERMATPETWGSVKEAIGDSLPNGGETYREVVLLLNPYKGDPYEVVTVGWDYNHIWNIEYDRKDCYTEVTVLGDAIGAIDAIADRVPDLTVFSYKDGSGTRIGDVSKDDPHFSDVIKEAHDE